MTTVTSVQLQTAEDAARNFTGAATSARSTALRLSLIVVIFSTLIELAIMLILDHLQWFQNPLTPVLDAAALSLVMIPALYFTSYRPLLRESRKRLAVEFEQNRLVAQLEARVAARTENLLNANQALATELRERLQLEQTRHEAEDFYRTLVEWYPEGISVFSLEPKCLFVNPAMVKMMGAVSADQLVGKQFRAHPDDQAAAAKAFWRAGQGLGAQSIEGRILRLDDTIFQEETTFVRVSFSGQDAVLCISRDLSEKHLLERSLRASDERFRGIFQQAMVGMLLIDAQRKVVDANPAVLRMLDYKFGEIVGVDFTALTLPDERTGHPWLPGVPAEDPPENGRLRHHVGRRRQRLIAHLLNGIDDDTKPLERRYVRKDGGVLLGRTTTFRVGNPNGQELRVIMVDDITEREQAERALRESETRFLALVDQAVIGIAIVDSDGKLVEANPALQKMLGYSEAELLDMNLAPLTHPDDLHIQRGLERELREGRREQYTLEKRFIRKDGSIFWGRVTKSLMNTEDGRELRLGMVEDISERMSASEEIDRIRRGWRNVWNGLAESIVILDADGIILSANRATTEIYSTPLVDICGKPCHEIFHTGETPLGCPGADLCATSGSRSPAEMTGECYGRTLKVTCQPIFDREGRLQNILRTAVDVTDSIRAELLEESKKESEQIYGFIVDNSPEPIMVASLENKFLYMNPAALRLVGASSFEQMQGLSTFDVIHPGDAQKATEDRDSAAAEGAGTRWSETRILRLDGTLVETASVYTPVTFQGQPAVLAVGHDLSERRRFEQEQARAASLENRKSESDQIYRYVVDNSPEAITLVSLEGKIIYANPASLKLVGASSAEELQGISSFQVIHQDDIQMTHKLIQEAAAEGAGLHRSETKVARLDGTLVEVANMYTPVTFEGQPAVLGVSHDLTEQRRIERERARLGELFQKSDESLRRLLEASPNSISVISFEGKVLYTNEAGVLIRGADGLEQVIGTVDRFHHDDYHRVRQAAKQAMPLGAPSRTVQFRLLRRDGKTIDVEATFKHVSYNGQDALLATSIDITERLRLEGDIKRSETRFRKLVEQAAMGIALVDLEGKLTESNPALERMLGYSRKELLGMDVNVYTHPDDLGSQKTLDRELSVGKRHRYTIDKRYVRKDGTLLWGRLTSTLLDTGDGTKLRIGMVEDISEARHALEELTRAERDWQGVFQSIAGPAMVLDPDHGIIAVNSATISALGGASISEADIIGRKCYELFHGTPGPVPGCPMEACLLSKRAETNEISSDLLERIYVESCSPMLSDRGEIVKVIHVCTDITDRVAVEEELRDNDKRLRAVFESVRLQGLLGLETLNGG